MRGRPAPHLVVVPRRDSQVERHSDRSAFHHFYHNVPEDDRYVRSLERARNHEAASERLEMCGLNAIPHFLCGDGCADECIPIAADVKKALQVLLVLMLLQGAARNCTKVQFLGARFLMSRHDTSIPMLLLHPAYRLCARHIRPRA